MAKITDTNSFVVAQIGHDRLDLQRLNQGTVIADTYMHIN